MKSRIVLLLSIIVCVVVASCAGNGAAAAATETPTLIPAIPTVPLPTATLTQTPTLIPSPTPAPPSTDVNLTKVNNAVMVFENGTWVVKNANRAVTATWNGTEWEYNTETLKITRTIIGFDGEDAALLDPLFETPLPKEPSEHRFIDPKTGEPIPYGYVREDFIPYETYKIPLSMYAVRVLGIVPVDSKNGALVFELPLSPDQSAIFVLDQDRTAPTALTVIDTDTFYASTWDGINSVPLKSQKSIDYFNSDYRGGQAIIALYHDLPAEIIAEFPSLDINEDCDRLLRFLQSPSTNTPPRALFIEIGKSNPYKVNTIWVPSTVGQDLSSP